MVASDTPRMGDVARAVATWVDRLLPDRTRASTLAATLLQQFDADSRAVTAEGVAQIERAAHAHSRHLRLEFVADGSLVADRDPPGWPSPDADAVASRAASVSAVTRRPDGIGVVRLDGLDAVSLAEPFLEGAFALLSGARGVVVDLRRNGGGEPATVALLLSWLLSWLATGPERHFADVIGRDGTRQWWTSDRSPARALPASTPVAVVTGDMTFSSAEALAFFVQSAGRGAVVGRRTPGAADHVTPVNITSHVRAHIPEAYVIDVLRGGNWEGTGVVPDVACDEVDAVDVAATLLAAC